jgi:hypothetical protein
MFGSYLTENGGTSGAISTGGVIAHGLGTTPSVFGVTPVSSSSVTQWNVTADATKLTVTFGGGGSSTFVWFARVNP